MSRVYLVLQDFNCCSLGEHLLQHLFDFRIEALFNLVRIVKVKATQCGRERFDAEPEFVKGAGALDCSKVLDHYRMGIGERISLGQKAVGVIIDAVGLLVLVNWVHLEVGKFSRDGRASLVELNLLGVRHFDCRLGLRAVFGMF